MPGTIAQAATYYDGRTASPHLVRFEIDGQFLHVVGDDVERRIALSELSVSEPVGQLPAVLHCRDGATIVLQANGASALAASAAVASRRPRTAQFVDLLDSNLEAALFGLLLVLASLVAAYLWLLPAAADVLAAALPQRLAVQMGEQALATLDEHLLQPTRLAPARIAALNARLAPMSEPDGVRVVHCVIFRDSPRLGANAVALPDGTIVVTDALVLLVREDDEVIAVIGHELGHVRRRHPLRELARASLLAMSVTWLTGDFGSLALGLSTMLLEASYSRDFEREADAYAARYLEANGLSPSLLAAALARLEGTRRGASVPAYLSTHPDTSERIDWLQRQSHEAGS